LVANVLTKVGFPVLARSSSQLAASDAWTLSSNHNAKQFILIRCKHSQRAARSFVRGLEIRLKTSTKCIYYLIAPILTNLFLCYHLGHLELSGQTLMITKH
jgi:hypothetical protein